MLSDRRDVAFCVASLRDPTKRPDEKSLNGPNDVTQPKPKPKPNGSKVTVKMSPSINRPNSELQHSCPQLPGIDANKQARPASSLAPKPMSKF